VSLRRNLVVSFALYAFAIVVAILIPFGVISSHAHRSSYVDEQIDDAQSVASSFGPDAPTATLIAERYAGRAVAAWLLDPQGEPSGEPTQRDAFPALVATAPEVEQARRGTSEARINETPSGSRVLAAVPILRRGRLAGVLWTSSSTAPVSSLDRQRWALLAGIGAAAMAGAALVGAGLSRRLTRRLEAVAAGASRFGEGHLDEAIPVQGSDEIAALAGSLNEMAGEIDRLVRREKSFVAAASHQIRTPLAAIKIRLDELLAAGDSFEPDAIEYLKEMAQEVDRLTALTARLLDLSSAESPPESRPLVASRAIREAIDRVSPLAQHHALSIRLNVSDEDALIAAPTGAFEEALFNLLDNAVKFSREGSDVDVDASLDNGTFVVDVADHGPGIPEGERARVLDPFYRATRSKPGYGLGLAISARLCEGAGATLRMEPREDGGTVARIRWPVAQRS
jgi:two-component system, OmpR family, sensor kinase